MKKHCCKCKQLKPLTAYYRAHKRPDGYQTQCKSCSADHQSKHNKHDGWVVYVLPIEHYVGISSQYKKRLCKHRSEHGRDTTDAFIFSEHDNVYDAIIQEALLHKSGYKGCQYD